MDKEYYRSIITAKSRSNLAPAPDESKGVGVEFRPQGQEIEDIELEEAKVRRMKKRKIVL
jgi:hypothetical protein